MGNTYNHHCNGDYNDDDDLIIISIQLLSQYDDDYDDNVDDVDNENKKVESWLISDQRQQQCGLQGDNGFRHSMGHNDPYGDGSEDDGDGGDGHNDPYNGDDDDDSDDDGDGDPYGDGDDDGEFESF